LKKAKKKAEEALGPSETNKAYVEELEKELGFEKDRADRGQLEIERLRNIIKDNEDVIRS